MNPAIDRGVIDELRELRTPGRPDPVASLIELFFENGSEGRETIKRALENRHPDVVCGAAHKPKSMAANLGANDLARACAELERHPADASLFASFDAELSRAAEELTRLLGDT